MRAQIVLKLSLAWWVRPYVFGVVTMSMLAGLEPDWDKVTAKVMRAIKVKVV